MPNSQLPTVEQPLFIIGTGRSGTTLAFDILHRHESLAWPTRAMARGRQPAKTEAAAGKLRRALLGRRAAKKFQPQLPDPEPYELWQRHYPGFARPCRDLRSCDVPQSLPAKIQGEFSRQLLEMDKPRFLTKYTGWSRIGFIDRIFPDARYLNVVRDGRAVAWSLLHVDWWEGWRGPTSWRWGPLTAEDQRIWEQADQSFFVLAGLQWKILNENIRARGTEIGDRYREIRYEDLVASPEPVLLDVLQWSGLPAEESFLQQVRKFKLRDSNEKWRRDAPPEEQRRFAEHLGETLAAFGYSNQQPSPAAAVH